MNYRWNLCVLMAVEIFCSLSLHAARWKLGPANVIEPKEFGTTERLVIGDGENRTWFWSSGWGISFYPSQDMPDTQDSGELRLGKTVGGRCHWTMTFRFTKPIDKFRFTTPKCSGIEMGGDIFFEYSADGSKAKEIWRYGAKSPGYQKGGEITPQVLPWLKQPPSRWLLALSSKGWLLPR